MPKREHTEDGEESETFETEESHSSSEESSSDDEDTDMLNVEFEWFDPQPQHDFQGIKTLLRQLFDVDAQLFDLSALTDLILAQPLLGSTVKVEGNESDPYAILTVLNLNGHAEKSFVSALLEYIKDRCDLDDRASIIQELLRDEKSCVGLILTERMINVPAQVVPPMYNMLLEEISWALEEKEPYKFTHYLILSKTYREIASRLDEEDDSKPKTKKQKKMKGADSPEIFYFHPEDEALQRHAATYSGYDYKNEAGQSDSKRAFQELGIKPQGHMILIEAEKFEAAVRAMQEFVG